MKFNRWIASWPGSLYLPVVQQADADQREADRPDPGGNSAIFGGEADFQPARPAGEHRQNPQGNMAHLCQEFLLNIGERVGMGQQQGSAGGAEERENQRQRAPAGGTPADAQFKDGKGDAEQRSHAMLEHFCFRPAYPKALRAQWPTFRIAARENEDGDPDQHQRPIFGPLRVARPRQQSKQTHGQHQHAHPVMVVFRPPDVCHFAAGERRSIDGIRRRQWGHRGNVDLPPGKGDESCASSGLANLGQWGLRREAMWAKSTVSFTRSTAGGCDVSEAAVRMMVMPIPTSASTRRRNRGPTASPLYLRNSKKLMPPSSSMAASMIALAETITP